MNECLTHAATTVMLNTFSSANISCEQHVVHYNHILHAYLFCNSFVHITVYCQHHHHHHYIPALANTMSPQSWYMYTIAYMALQHPLIESAKHYYHWSFLNENIYLYSQ